MPKASGQDLKTVRLAPRPQPPARKIMSFDSAPGPKVDPSAQGAPKRADELKSNSNIDPRQMVY